jgi:hypothetical protein
MLTSPYIVQQFLAACIGNTEDETDPSVSDTEQRDEQQTELELAADDNSTNDAESEASDASDTPAPEPSEIENADEGSASEETPTEDEASPVAIDDDSSHTESNSEVLPISIDEEAHASEDDPPDTSSAEETPVVEIPNLAPSDDEATEPPEDTDPVSEDKTEFATEIVISEQENEGTITQHAQVSDVEADKDEATLGKSAEETPKQKPQMRPAFKPNLPGLD